VILLFVFGTLPAVLMPIAVAVAAERHPRTPSEATAPESMPW
jgi:hypothetical protein